jgi:hypothetical protein
MYIAGEDARDVRTVQSLDRLMVFNWHDVKGRLTV